MFETGTQFGRVRSTTQTYVPNPMSSSGKSSFSLSKFPELSLIIVILALGLILAIFGGSVRLPKFQTTIEDALWPTEMKPASLTFLSVPVS